MWIACPPIHSKKLIVFLLMLNKVPIMLDSKLMSLDMRLLVAFRAVAEELHFGRAASRLFITQSPLSLQIKRLEEQVGAPLFTRTTRSVTLTPAGRIFQVHLKRVFESIDLMLKETRNAAEGGVGMLSIGLTPAACMSPVVQVLHNYRMTHPGIMLELIEVSSLETAALLRRGTIDVGVMRPGPRQADISSLTSFKEPICLAVRHDDDLATKTDVSAQDLALLALINYSSSDAPYLNGCVSRIYSYYGIIPKIVQESRLPTILTLVEAGAGAALAPQSSICSTQLRAIPLRQNPEAVAHFDIVKWAPNESNVTTGFITWLNAGANQVLSNMSIGE